MSTAQSHPASSQRVWAITALVIVASNLLYTVVTQAAPGMIHPTAQQAVNLVAFAAIAFAFARDLDRARRTELIMSETAASLLAEPLGRATRFAAESVRQTADEACCTHRMRIQAAEQFLRNAYAFHISSDRMRSLLSDVDPIVLKDVAERMEHAREPAFDPQTGAPWAKDVLAHVRKRSALCHRPCEIRDWNKMAHAAIAC